MKEMGLNKTHTQSPQDSGRRWEIERECKMMDIPTFLPLKLPPGSEGTSSFSFLAIALVSDDKSES